MSREMFFSIAAVTEVEGKALLYRKYKNYALYKYLTFCLYRSAKYTVVHMFATLPVKEIQFISI